MSTLYLAGPMTGLPDENRPLFRRAAEQLRKAGYTVYSPVEWEPQDASATYDDKLEIDISMIMKVRPEMIVLLPGWENSKGARAEAYIIGEFMGHTVARYISEGESFRLAQFRPEFVLQTVAYSVHPQVYIENMPNDPVTADTKISDNL